MDDQSVDRNWKLKLRYGRLQTPYKHFTSLAEGVVTTLPEGFDCPLGSAWMAMKTWASSRDEAADMIRIIGEQIGFHVTGRTLVYDTEPTQPPRADPFGYDIHFTPFDT